MIALIAFISLEKHIYRREIGSYETQKVFLANLSIISKVRQNRTLYEISCRTLCPVLPHFTISKVFELLKIFNLKGIQWQKLNSNTKARNKRDTFTSQSFR